MAGYRDVIKDPENQNWVKSVLALHITREGLLRFVENGISQFHVAALYKITSGNPKLSAGTTCNSCATCQLLPCPAAGICRKTHGNCKYHTIQLRPCPVGICDKIKTEIEANHRFPNPSWKNTDAKTWYTNSWQIAKCYMPPDGYSDVQTPEQTDFNGIVSVILNCKTFDNIRSQARHATLFDEVKLTRLYRSRS